MVVVERRTSDFTRYPSGILLFNQRMCVTEEQFYHSSDSSKMYQDVKKRFWWPGMKRDIADFVVKCMICTKVKIEHQIPEGMIKPLDITEWKL